MLQGCDYHIAVFIQAKALSPTTVVTSCREILLHPCLTDPVIDFLAIGDSMKDVNTKKEDDVTNFDLLLMWRIHFRCIFPMGMEVSG